MEIKGLIPERSSAVEMKAGIIIQTIVRKVLFLKYRKEMPCLSILKSDEKFPLTSQEVKIRFLKTLLNAPGNASINLWYNLFQKRALAVKKAYVLSRWNSVILAENQMSSSKVLRSLSQAALSYYRWLFIQKKITVTSLFTIKVNTLFQEQDFLLISL